MAEGKNKYPTLGLSFTDTEEDSKSVYDVWATTYEEDSDVHGYKGHVLCLEGFDKAMQSGTMFPNPNKNIKILDAGAGTGWIGAGLAQRGYSNVDGLDISPEMLKLAEKKNVYKRLICAPLSEKRIEEISTGEYDVVLSGGTIVYGQVKPEAIDECIRFVKPGGLFIFTIRVDSYDPEEYGYNKKCEELEKAGKWTQMHKERKELHSNPPEERFRDCYLIIFKVHCN